MDDLETLKRAHLLLGQYGFLEEQESLARAIRIVAATAKRLGVVSEERVRIISGSPGDRLKRLRERVGLTRHQMAERCGVAMATLRSHENGEGALPEDALRDYAQALGVTPAMILYGAD